MSSKLPIGVATIDRPLIILSIIYIFIFIISCTPVNLSKQDTKNTQETTISEKSFNTKSAKKVIEKTENKQDISVDIRGDSFNLPGVEKKIPYALPGSVFETFFNNAPKNSSNRHKPLGDKLKTLEFIEIQGE